VAVTSKVYVVEPALDCEPLDITGPGVEVEFSEVDQLRVTGLVPMVVTVTTYVSVPELPQQLGEPAVMLMLVTWLRQDSASDIGVLTVMGAVMSRVSLPLKGLADGVQWSVTSTVWPAAMLTDAGAVVLPFDRTQW